MLNVKKISYKNIFNNLSFNIPEKSFSILIGKNGVGKTTLVYAILELIKYEGEIKFKYKRSDIGCISDYTEINKDTVFAYLSEPLRNLNYSEDKINKTIYSISKRLSLDNIINKHKNELNKEEELMILLAHAVIHNPKLVIIDNTLDELRESIKLRFLNYIRSMKSTVIFVTNDSRYFKYGNRLLIMNESKIEVIKDSNSINKLENILVKNNSELPFYLELSSKLYSYGIIKELYSNGSELVDNIWN